MNWLKRLFGYGYDEDAHLKPAAHGFALCIGLNSVNPQFYEGWSGELSGCENDANALAHWLETKNFSSVEKLLTKQATRDQVMLKLKLLAELAIPGDLVVVTNSSHGGQIPDFDSTEADGMDETICMYDGQLIDDELELCWSRFRRGVRIVFVSDSCHSGTVMRAAFSDYERMLTTTPHSKAMPGPIISAIVNAQHETLLGRKALAARQHSEIVASVLALGACQDSQVAMDGPINGAFTGALLSTLRRFPTNSYGRVIAECRRALPPSQTPSYTYAGPRSTAFESSTVFSF